MKNSGTLDDFLIRTENEDHYLISKGFSCIKTDKNTVWSGSFNIHTKIIEFEKITNNRKIVVTDLIRKSDSKQHVEDGHQLFGSMILKHSISPFFIHSNQKFSLFKRFKNQVDKYYDIEGEITNLTDENFQSLLINLIGTGVRIDGKSDNVSFEFSFDKFSQKNYISVLSILEKL